MMHTKRDYEFVNEADAIEFAEQQKVPYDPSADVYVRGPFLVDEKETFKNMDWVTPREPYWKVTVEIYK
jgi:hypothetical protein